MALNESSLKSQIKSLAKDLLKAENQEEGLEKYSSEMAKIITNYIKTATIVVPAGQVVQVVPATGTGSTTTPINATIS